MTRLPNIIQRYLLIALLPTTVILHAQTVAQQPVTPNASPEAKALLQLLYKLSGKYTLTGQHNYPNTGDTNTVYASHYIGETPVIWSCDFGFGDVNDKDSRSARPAIVEEAIRQFRKGSLITLCWHAVPPTADEPVTFQPLPGADPNRLQSVQGRLLDEQFRDVLTPGTELNKKWMAQVDTIAYYLKQLQDAHVPVLWRPYHEMNGDWFWWGNRTGMYSTKALYNQLFDRFVNYHKLNNLIWVWSVDRPSRPGLEFDKFYPGNEHLDILALDVYGSDFNPDYYKKLSILSNGKPVTLAEVGNPPGPDVLKQQPKWSYWVTWAGMVRNTTHEQYDAFLDDPRILFQEDSAYVANANPFRKACGLTPLPFSQPADFTGTWVFDESKSDLAGAGSTGVAVVMNVSQMPEALAVTRAYVQEFTENRVSTDTLLLDGTPDTTMVYGAPRVTTATLSGEKDTIEILSMISFNGGSQPRVFTNTQTWALTNHNHNLVITELADTFRGQQQTVIVYDRRDW